MSIAVRGDEADWYLRFLVHVANVPSWLFRRVDGLLKHWFEGDFTSEYAADRLINYFGLVVMPTLVTAFFLVAFIFNVADTAELAWVVLNLNIGLVLLLSPLLIITAASAQFLMVSVTAVVPVALGDGERTRIAIRAIDIYVVARRRLASPFRDVGAVRVRRRYRAATAWRLALGLLSGCRLWWGSCSGGSAPLSSCGSLTTDQSRVLRPPA